MNGKPQTIVTSRLQLRAFEEKDAPAAIRIFMNQEVAKTYMLPDFASSEAARPLFDRLRQLSLAEDRFVYGIYQGETLVGFLNDVDKTDRFLELGYVIHPDHKGQGFATEALTACVEALFDMGYQAVRAGAFAENPASMRVMEKSGMARIQLREQIEYRGIIHDCVYYEIEKAPV